VIFCDVESSCSRVDLLGALGAVLRGEALRPCLRAACLRSLAGGAAPVHTSRDVSRPALRLMTYNIRHGRGADGRVDLGRIADVIATWSPDVLALQEVDVRRARSGAEDQAEALARRLGMDEAHFAPCVAHGGHEFYGIATLSRLPICGTRQLRLPHDGRYEPRSALLTRLSWGPGDLDLVNTHLSLRRSERAAQARVLNREFSGHDLVVAGDLNCTPFSGCYRVLLGSLRGATGRALTWPALLPVMQLDHVLYRGHLAVREAGAVTGSLARRASDHLPIAATFIHSPGHEVATLTDAATGDAEPLR
jgi:endonuclease/exonuclease/phosphatase family metal-dependent hydrolase